MRLNSSSGDPGPVHLSYCTNVHPGESWADTLLALRAHLPLVKARVAPTQPFGVGLRLSARAAEELAVPETLAAFQAFLSDHGLYVFTLNGFPYGAFHGERVKDQVYLPDWRATDRLRYSDQLADLLAALLPEDHGLGTISTVPGGYRPHLAHESDGGVHAMAANLRRHAVRLNRIAQDTGRHIVLALEPEPSCLLETSADTVRFFESHVLHPESLADMAARLGGDKRLAEQVLRTHLGVCLDACHAAVEFEDPLSCLTALEGAGIRIAKAQLSVGLQADGAGALPRRAFDELDDAVYLHQVVERLSEDGMLRRFDDLPQALAALDDGDLGMAREWRVHFHVPVWCRDLGSFTTTQPFLQALLARHRERPIAPHLEVETYTWNVLPPGWRTSPLDEAIARELNWVLDQLS